MCAVPFRTSSRSASVPFNHRRASPSSGQKIGRPSTVLGRLCRYPQNSLWPPRRSSWSNTRARVGTVRFVLTLSMGPSGSGRSTCNSGGRRREVVRVDKSDVLGRDHTKPFSAPHLILEDRDLLSSSGSMSRPANTPKPPLGEGLISIPSEMKASWFKSQSTRVGMDGSACESKRPTAWVMTW